MKKNRENTSEGDDIQNVMCKTNPMFNFNTPTAHKSCLLIVPCSIYQSVLYVISTGGPVTSDKVAESKATKINRGRVNGKANTVRWQLGHSGYFHPDIRSKLSFSSPVTFTPPSPNPLPPPSIVSLFHCRD